MFLHRHRVVGATLDRGVVGHDDDLYALDAIYGHLERWPELVENLRRKIRITEDEVESIDHQFRMGQV